MAASSLSPTVPSSRGVNTVVATFWNSNKMKLLLQRLEIEKWKIGRKKNFQITNMKKRKEKVKKETKKKKN